MPDQTSQQLQSLLDQATNEASHLSYEDIESKLTELEQAKEDLISKKEWDQSNGKREQIIGMTVGMMMKIIDEHPDMEDNIKNMYKGQIPNTKIPDAYRYQDRIILLTLLKQFRLRITSETQKTN